jgi:hypothetical protein
LLKLGYYFLRFYDGVFICRKPNYPGVGGLIPRSYMGSHVYECDRFDQATAVLDFQLLANTALGDFRNIAIARQNALTILEYLSSLSPVVWL